MLWISSFNATTGLPHPQIPIIVLTTPETRLEFEPDVFIPVGTPGVDHAGQLFRTDGVVALPLKQLRCSYYSSVDVVLKQIIKNIPGSPQCISN